MASARRVAARLLQQSLRGIRAPQHQPQPAHSSASDTRTTRSGALSAGCSARRQHGAKIQAAASMHSSGVRTCTSAVDSSNSSRSATEHNSSAATTTQPLLPPADSTVASQTLADSIRRASFLFENVPPLPPGLTPLPPNTKPDPGDQYADARRALWRALNHKEPYACPACRQPIYKFEVLRRHLARCCPDLITTEALQPVGDHEDRLRQLLQQAEAVEIKNRERGLNLGFRDVDENGVNFRRSTKEVARIMGLPEHRTKVMMRLAMKSIPLKQDLEDIDVLFEDEFLIAVNKPPGVLTAPKHRYVGGSMVNRLLPYLGEMPRVLHRLDMYTSGVVLFAKTQQATQDIHRQFRMRSVSKSYLAIASGVPASSQFVVNAPIDRHPGDKFVRLTTSPIGQASETHFTVLDANAAADLSCGEAPKFPGPVPHAIGGAVLVSCKPVTGRTHQIRVHLAHVGHPIVGDDFYGVTGPWIGRQALHAAALSVTHPATGQPLHLQAPLLPDFRQALHALDLSCPEQYY